MAGALLSISLYAQGQAQIQGVVLDSSGLAVPGADVKATQTETGAVRNVTTGADGAYVLTNLPIGPYRMEVGKQGFASYVQTGIVLQVNTNPTIDVSLSLGLVVTELVINSLKHAFKTGTKGGQIAVTYEVSGTDWKLSVVDNGIGKPDGVFAQPKSGLGTGIVKALAKQLGSQVVTLSGPTGTTVSITHATFAGGAG